MKIRLIAVMLVFALAAWLPLAAQQPAPAPSPAPATPSSPEPAKPDAKSACACCSHDMAAKDQAKTEKHDHHAMACCNGKSATEMSCCKGQPADGKTAMEYCKNHDAKLCAPKDGKSCCDSKDGKSCCGKDAAACNAKDGKNCCNSKDSSCCKQSA